MKRNVFITILLVIACFLIFNGCNLDEIDGNGNIETQEREAEDFNSVSLRGVGDVNIYHAENFKVEVITDSNIQGYIKIKTSGSNLYIDGESSIGGLNPTKLIINISMPEVVSIGLTGAGNININNGKTTNLQIILSGAGDINALNYEAKNVIVNLTGAGDIKLWATTSLSGKLSGAGNILFKGNPSININKTGVGKVSKL